MTQHHVQLRGFTFLEVLVVLGVLGVLVGLAIPFYQSFQVDSRLDDTAHEVVQTLRIAQSKAMASESFSAHGVHFEAQRFILFRGDTYVVGDPFNEVTGVAQPLSFTSGDIVFDTVTGITVGSTITVSTSTGRTRTVTINSLGVVDVQ